MSESNDTVAEASNLRQIAELEAEIASEKECYILMDSRAKGVLARIAELEARLTALTA